jgi:hypothetical protein
MISDRTLRCAALGVAALLVAATATATFICCAVHAV